MTRCRTSIRLLLLGLGVFLQLGLAPLVAKSALADGTDGQCSIDGPSTIWIGDSFKLCGPDSRTTYEWTGPGTLSSASSRCVTVTGLPLGSHTFRLVTTKVNNGGTHRQTCEITVRVTNPKCDVSGPTTVEANTSFQLCGPSYDGASYSWSGPGVPSGSSSKCVSIGGLSPGTHRFTLTVSKNGYSSECTYDVRVLTPITCSITGPTTVDANATFQLCGVEQTGCSYSWSGPGIQSGGSSRCVTIAGLSAGTYTFTLTVHLEGRTRQCTYQVTVRPADVQCLITGSSTVDANTSFQLCGPEHNECSYSWSGPGIQSGGSSRCVTIAGLSAGTYTYTLTLDLYGTTRQCTFQVTVRSPVNCVITGPTSVDAGASFQLCGPDGYGGSYSWTGQGIQSGGSSKCVTISGLSAGTYSFTLRYTRDGVTRECTYQVTVRPVVNCVITGPTTVDANATFQLCGPDHSGSTYYWTGQGIQSGGSSKCVTISGLSAGTYTFTLRYTRDGVTRECTYQVTVRAAVNCVITGPSTVNAGASFQLCGPDNGAYSWSGPGIQSGGSSKCVTISGLSVGTYTFTLNYTRDGQSRQCTFQVTVQGTAPQCSINGPAYVGTDTTFSLCGPDVAGTTWSWSGPGIVSGTHDRCIAVQNLQAGNHTFTLTVTRSGMSSTCTFTVRVISRAECFVTGPAYVGTDSSFTLCGPSGTGMSWSWSGPNLTGDTHGRCVTVSGLSFGTHTYTLTVTQNGMSSTCTFTVRAIQRLQCVITGPSTVNANTSFQLCGPDHSGSSFSWSGPGIQTGGSSRCVTIAGLSAGTYTYTLTVSLNGTSRQCTFQVTVQGTAPQCSINGPAYVGTDTTFSLCGPDVAGTTWSWSGPGIVSSTHDRCIAVQNLQAGNHTFTLTVTRSGMSSTCTFTVRVISRAECFVTGPAYVGTDSSFTLCGPSGAGMTWSWSGPNLSGGTHGQCVSVGGLTAGTHTYTLTVTQNGMSRTCTFTVRAIQRATCEITGPRFVGRDSAFTLCGPSGDGLSWSWSGQNLSGDTHSRCVRVNGLAPGTYTYSLTLNRQGVSSFCTFTVHVLDRDGALCVITGPSSVRAGQHFTLCGPMGHELEYFWQGAGVPDDSIEARCVLIDGLQAGTYTYTLFVAGPNDKSSCTFTVTVTGTGASESCPRPLSFWRKECGDQKDDGHDGDVLSRQQLEAVAACVDDRTSAFTWSHDLTSFCALVDVNAWNRRSRARQQLGVLLANVCAHEQGLTDRNGDRIGIDPSSRLACDVLGARTVGDLIPRVEALLDRCRNPLLFDVESWRGLNSVYKCLRTVNRGLGFEDGHCGDKEDDLRAASMETDVDSEEPQLARAMPNPFSSTMRLQYAIEDEPARVEIGVYDIAGRLVQRLVNQVESVGLHDVRWNGVDANGSRVRPGVYFVRGTIGAEPLNARIMYLQ